VTFDLGFDPYEIDVANCSHSETLSGVTTTDCTVYAYGKYRSVAKALEDAQVGIHIHKEERNYNPSEEELLTDVKERVDEVILASSNGIEIRAANRIIDGHPGAVAYDVMSEHPIYEAEYVLSTNPYINVEIWSGFPWDSGTLSLLKTLHIGVTGA